MKIIVPLMLCCGLSAALPAQSLFDSLYNASYVEVYFSTGKADLNTEALATLDSITLLFSKNERFRLLRITAHTDSIGEKGNNESLAGRRAAVVRAALIERGIPADKVQTRAFGERSPVMTNSTESGRQRNRRATVEAVMSVPMTSFRGQIKDRTTGKGIEALVSFRTKTRTDSTRTDSTGHYSVRLPKDSIVKVEAVAKNYFFEDFTTRIFGSPELYKKYKINTDIELPPAKPGEKAVLRNLFFVGDQAILLKMSESELPKILKFMQINPDLRVEIAGHINKPGKPIPQPEADEMELSINRARVIYDYLLKNGVKTDRLRFKGYGNSEMMFPNALSPKESEQNRRVEIRVLQ
ncbi:MAG: OmpA family protein [Saprospiraceae bacterium]|nr:OmpA family protein [Saprospiraceae bacterium]